MVASRVTHNKKTIGIGRVDVEGSFAPNGASALVAASTYGKGFSVARSGVGLYTVTFDNVYPELVAMAVTPQVADGAPTIAQLGDYTAASKTIQIRILQAVAAAAAAQGKMLPIPLALIRELSTAEMPAISDTPLTDDPDGFGGLLAVNTTPKLFTVNGASGDIAQVLQWASSNNDVVSAQVPLPEDLDTSSDLVLKFRAKMGGSTDTPTIGCSSYFDESDTAVADTSDALGAAWAEQTITIAAADIPSGAKTVTVNLTPGAHTADALNISSMWLEYTSTQSGGFVLTDQSADANCRVHFKATFRNTSVDF